MQWHRILIVKIHHLRRRNLTGMSPYGRERAVAAQTAWLWTLMDCGSVVLEDARVAQDGCEFPVCCWTGFAFRGACIGSVPKEVMFKASFLEVLCLTFEAEL